MNKIFSLIALTVLALVAGITPAFAQECNPPAAVVQDYTSAPSALPGPQEVRPPTPSDLIGLFRGDWEARNPVYGKNCLEITVNKVTGSKVEGTLNVQGGVRPTNGHVKFFDGRSYVEDGVVTLSFTRYMGPTAQTYVLRLTGDRLEGTAEVPMVIVDVRLRRKK